MAETSNSGTVPRPPAPPRSTLTLRDVCTALVTSGEISQEDAERVLSANLGAATGDGQKGKRHPLELVAIAALTSQKSGRTLDLADPLAGRLGRATLLPH